MAKERDWTQALTQAAVRLFDEGMTDPSAEEIAHAYYEGKLIGNETIEGVRKKLKMIRDLLVRDYGQSVYLVSRMYYTRFRATPADELTPTERRQCLPLGHGVKADGLRLQTGTDDPLWHEWIELTLNNAAAKMKHGADRVVHGVDAGRVSERAAGELLVGAAEHARPEKPEIAARAMLSLQPGEADEGA